MTYGKDYKLNSIRLYYNREKLNLSILDILNFQNIARSTLYYWIKDKDITKNNSKKKRKRHGKITDACENFILSYVNEHKQFKIKKLLKIIGKKFNISISKQSVYNTLKNNKITNKRIKENHYPYDEQKLKIQKDKLIEDLEKIEYDPISIDESAIYLYTHGNYGWSVMGTECEIKGKTRVKKLSLALAISRSKIVGFTLRCGSFNAKTFNKFMMEKIRKNNKENKKYFMDNAKIHHAKILNDKIKNNCVYNVPYYSKFNPIEMFFNSLKRYLNSIYIKSIFSVRRHINFFIQKVNSIELNNYFDKAFSFLKD